MVNVARTVPDGLEMFFPSYAYAATVLAHWHTSGLLAQLSKHKQVWSESRDRNSNQGSTLLHNYAAVLATGAGALLCCVVRGKMSEGINFSDGLAR